jgi:hypothetical protein
MLLVIVAIHGLAGVGVHDVQRLDPDGRRLEAGRPA